MPCQPKPPAPPELSTTSLLHLQNPCGILRDPGTLRDRSPSLSYPTILLLLLMGGQMVSREACPRLWTPTNSVLSFPPPDLDHPETSSVRPSKTPSSPPALPGCLLPALPTYLHPLFCESGLQVQSSIVPQERTALEAGTCLSLDDSLDTVLVCWASE